MEIFVQRPSVVIECKKAPPLEASHPARERRSLDLVRSRCSKFIVWIGDRPRASARGTLVGHGHDAGIQCPVDDVSACEFTGSAHRATATIGAPRSVVGHVVRNAARLGRFLRLDGYAPDMAGRKASVNVDRRLRNELTLLGAREPTFWARRANQYIRHGRAESSTRIVTGR